MDPRVWGGIALLVGAFGAGWFVNGWRLDASHAEQVAELRGKVSDLTLKIETQNHAVDAMKIKSEAADSRRKLAEEMTRVTLARIGDRSAAVAASKATNCDGVLKEAWGDWK